MGTHLYATEVVKKDALGNYSVVDLTIDTNSPSVTSGSPLTEFTVDGVSLGAVAPTLFSGVGVDRATITLKSGAIVQAGILSFSDGINDYYAIYPASGPTTAGSDHIDANRVANVELGTMTELIDAFPSYKQFHVFDSKATMYQGEALLTFGTTPWVETIYVADDDPLIELNSGGGSPETGNDPQATSAGLWGGVLINLGLASKTTENIVTVNYTTENGSGSFDAIATTYSTRTYYIPENGHVDLSTITGISSVVETEVALSGSSYGDFGLTTGEFVQVGADSDEILVGDIGHDQIFGGGGHDTIYGDGGNDFLNGGTGRDLIYGGGGEDSLFGGFGRDVISGGMNDDILHGRRGNDDLNGNSGNDILRGGSGNDTLRGERGDDTLKGQAGADKLKGGTGDDILIGGKGRDDLNGHGGADSLDGGRGVDTMTGGGGVDTFILNTDGKTDTITDFQDGADLIDLDVGFAALTINDVALGEVHIVHSGETLIVQDNGLGLLTAADFSAADFL